MNIQEKKIFIFYSVKLVEKNKPKMIKTQTQNNENPQFYVVKGQMLISQFNFDEAIKYFDKAIDLDYNLYNAHEGKAVALHGKGLLLAELNQDEDSIFYYNRSIEIFLAIENKKQLSNVLVNKALRLVALKKDREAFESVCLSIQYDPSNFMAFNNKGALLHDFNEYNEAIECYNKSIELNPNFLLAYNNKGFAYIELNQDDKAFECFNKAKQIDPFNITAIKYLKKIKIMKTKVFATLSLSLIIFYYFGFINFQIFMTFLLCLTLDILSNILFNRNFFRSYSMRANGGSAAFVILILLFVYFSPS